MSQSGLYSFYPPEPGPTYFLTSQVPGHCEAGELGGHIRFIQGCFLSTPPCRNHCLSRGHWSCRSCLFAWLGAGSRLRSKTGR